MLGKIHFVSAGAGSGKTWRLTEILQEKLSSGEVRPSGVMATTFTKRAAAELRERVRASLLENGKFQLANTMGQARIGTVNSLCGGLLARFAFEAGLSTDQQVLEEGAGQALIREAIDSVQQGPALGELLQLTERLGLDNETWQGALFGLINQTRANNIEAADMSQFAQENADDLLNHFPRPTRQQLTLNLQKAIATALPVLEAQAEAGGKGNTRTYLELVQRVQRRLESGSVVWNEWLSLAKVRPEVALNAEADSIKDIAARVAEHRGFQQDIRDYLERIFALAAAALQAYAERKRELGVLDFVDQEHLLLQLLDHPAVAEALSSELDLLLVDEFQDTSPIQLALFLKLAGFAKSIYWVGDIKQAIYGFRGSDTALMASIVRSLPEMGGDKEILSSSWRSRKLLVDIVNAVFGNAFANTLPKDEIELKSQRKESLKGAPLANWILGGKNKGMEWSALASGVRRLIDEQYQVFDKQEETPRSVRHGDVVILARANDTVKEIAAALAQQGIPCATSQPGLLATPEAKLVLACLRRLNDAGDTLASAEIMALADCIDAEDWVSDRLRHMAEKGDSDAWQEDRHPLLCQIAVLRQSLPVMAPAEALRTVITACDLPSRVLRWKQDAAVARQRLTNIEALMALAQQYEDSCASAHLAASISGLILWVTEQGTEKLDFCAEPAIDAVRVMTHHAAKGLEWPVVILVDLAKDVQDRLWSITAMSRQDFDPKNPLQNRFIRYWPWPFGTQKKVEIAEIIAQGKTGQEFRAAAVEEAKRLLYVSMTRARDLMVLARGSRTLTGEWLDTVDASWLLPKEGEKKVTLPSGEKIAATRWDLEAVEQVAVAAAETPLFWFASAEGQEIRLPLVCNPSAVVPTGVGFCEQIRIGERLGLLKSGIDMGLLGSALHACIAAAFTPGAVVDAEEVAGILQRMGVAGAVSAEGVAGQIVAFQQWIRERWGEVKAFAEYPVHCELENGQLVQGRIDLLLETDSGWVLIDHKSTPVGAERWAEELAGYSGQLATYCQAIERASGKNVSESWLFLPVAGGGVRFSTSSRNSAKTVGGVPNENGRF